MMTDWRGVIEYVNPAFAVLTGYTRDEACGKSPCISPIRRAGSGGLPGTLWKTILAGNVFRGILVNRKKNGELYYVEVSICPVRDGQGHSTHFVAKGRDLTERLGLEAQLVQAQKWMRSGAWPGGGAHDFNALPTIITSYSELALDEVPGNPSHTAKIQEILQAARRAAELTRGASQTTNPPSL